MYRGRSPCERARNTDSRFLPETSEVGLVDLPQPSITARSPKMTIPDRRAVLWYRVLSDCMTLACGLIWVGHTKRMSCTTVLTALTSSPIMLTSAVHATRLNTYNIIQRVSRHRNEERQHSSDAQRERLHARDEEHFSLRDEANARTQLLQKIPLCEKLATLVVTHRED